MKLSQTTLTRSIAATITLSAALGLSACSDDSKNTAADKAHVSVQAQSSNASTQDTQNAKPWLVNGKVDITKVSKNSIQDACNTLLGSAEQGARMTGVDRNNESTADLKNFTWTTLNVFSFGDINNRAYTTLTCEPVAHDDQGQNNSYELPSVTVAAYTDGKPGPEIGPFKKDPMFGFGATDVKTVGNASVYSKTNVVILADPNATSKLVPTTGGSATEDLNDEFPNPDSKGLYGATRDQRIAEWKAGNEAHAKITRPLVEKAAQNVYGG